MAKIEKYGGNPRCIIAEPEVFRYKINEQTDYILLGSDGIFDKIETPKVAEIISQEVQQYARRIASSKRRRTDEVSFE